MINGFFDGRIKKAFDGWIKVIQWNKNANFIDGDGFCCGLEGIEHGTLAASQVHSGGTRFTNGFKDALNELELVGSERIIFNEVIAVLIMPEGHTAVFKCELAFENIATFFVDIFQFGFH